MRTSLTCAIVFLFVAGSALAVVEVDLSGTSSGALIDAVGADFAQSFVGQSVVGNGISGTPTGPLTLQPGGEITVELFAYGYSLLPQPNNQAPLSCLLETTGKGTITWFMGHGEAGSSVDVDFFDENGERVFMAHRSMSPAYTYYTFDVPVDYKGFTIYNNNDPGGLRFYDFVYTESEDPVATESGSWDEVKALYR